MSGSIHQYGRDYNDAIAVGGYLYMGSERGIVVKIDISTFKIVATFNPVNNAAVSVIACLATDGTYLYVGQNNGKYLRITLSNFTTFITKDMGAISNDYRGPAGLFCYNGHLYIVPGNGGSTFPRILLSDFNTVTTCALGPAGITFADGARNGFCQFENYVIVVSEADAKVYRADLDNFDTAHITVLNITASGPAPYSYVGPGSYDGSAWIYFSANGNDQPLIRINKACTAFETFLLGDGVAGLTYLNGMDLYTVYSDGWLGAEVVRIDLSSSATFNQMTYEFIDIYAYANGELYFDPAFTANGINYIAGDGTWLYVIPNNSIGNGRTNPLMRYLLSDQANYTGTLFTTDTYQDFIYTFPTATTIVTMVDNDFGDVSFDAIADRFVVIPICVKFDTLGASIISMTIQGITATKVVEAVNPNGYIYSAIFTARVPAGVDGDVVVNSSANFLYGDTQVYAFYHLQNNPPARVAKAIGSGTVATVNTSMQPLGILITCVALDATLTSPGTNRWVADNIERDNQDWWGPDGAAPFNVTMQDSFARIEQRAGFGGSRYDKANFNVKFDWTADGLGATQYAMVSASFGHRGVQGAVENRVGMHLAGTRGYCFAGKLFDGWKEGI